MGSFRKAWNYLMASFSNKINEYADPQIQINQFVEEAKQQHAHLAQQASAIIGNRDVVLSRRNRQAEEVEQLNVQVRQALSMGKDDVAAGLSAQLVTAEDNLAELSTLYNQACAAAEQAKQQVQADSNLLHEKLAEAEKTRAQVQQAKFTEQTQAALNSMNGSILEVEGNTPSLESIRQKIEGRYARATGMIELSQGSVQGNMLEIQQASTVSAGQAKLEQIRASMQAEKYGDAIDGEVISEES